MGTLTLDTVTVNTLNISTITGGEVVGAFDVIVGTSTFSNSVELAGGSGVSLTVSGYTVTFSTEATVGVNRIVVDGSSIGGNVVFAANDYSSVSLNGSTVIIGSTIPLLQNLSGTITQPSHGSIPNGDPHGQYLLESSFTATSIVNQVIVPNGTLYNTITLVQGNNVTINANGNSITFSAVGSEGTVPNYLSELTIDANKDWQGYTITNMGAVVIGSDATLSRSGIEQLWTNANFITEGWMWNKDGQLWFGEASDTALWRYGISTLGTDNLYVSGNLIVGGTMTGSDMDAVIVGGSTLDGTITLVAGSNMTITVSSDTITFSSGGTGGGVGSLSALTIDSNKNWQGYTIGNLGGLTITGESSKLIFSNYAAAAQLTFPLVFPFTFTGTSDYVEIYASESSLIVHEDLYVEDEIHAVGNISGNALYMNQASSYLFGVNANAEVYWGNSVNAWDFHLGREGLHTLRLYDSADFHITGGLKVDGNGGSVITALAFAYVGTLTTGTSVSPLLVTPCSLDIVNVKAIVKTACGSGSIIVDVNKDGTTVFSTQANRPTLPSGSLIVTSSAPDVTSLPEGSVIAIDIDSVGNSIGADLSVIVKCRQKVVYS